MLTQPFVLYGNEHHTLSTKFLFTKQTSKSLEKKNWWEIIRNTVENWRAVGDRIHNQIWWNQMDGLTGSSRITWVGIKLVSQWKLFGSVSKDNQVQITQLRLYNTVNKYVLHVSIVVCAIYSFYDWGNPLSPWRFFLLILNYLI